MPLNKSEPPSLRPRMQNQNASPALLPRNPKPTKSKAESVSIGVKPPIGKKPPTNSNAACTDQIEILEENPAEGRIGHQNVIDLPPRGLNKKFIEKSMGVNEEIHLREQAFHNTTLRDHGMKNGVSSLPLPAIVKVPPTNSNAACTDQIEVLEENLAEGRISDKNLVDLPPRGLNRKFTDTSMSVNEKIHLREQAFNKGHSSSTVLKPTIPRPLNIFSKHTTVEENLEKLSDKETYNMQQNNFESNIQNLKLPTKKLPKPPLPIFKAKANEGTRINVSSNSVLYEEIRETKIEEELKGLPKVSRKKTNKTAHEHEFQTTANNSEFISGKETITWAEPEYSNHLPVNKAVDFKKPSYFPDQEECCPNEIYEEINETENENELKGWSDVSRANKAFNNHEFHTTANNSQLISGKEKIIWEEPDYSNDLPPIKSVDTKKQSYVKNFADKEKCSPRLAFIIKYLREEEIKYIAQLENALKISNKLGKEDVLGLTYTKIFGYFQEIQSFHKNEFLAEINRSETPKQFVLSFVKHFVQFDLYIKREWLFSSNVPDSESVAQFYLITENKTLSPYINLTTQRLSEYARHLRCFRSVCEEEKDLDNRVAVDQAIKIIENVEDQIQKVQQFKKLFGKDSEAFKECGKVRLIEKFKISINGSSRKSLLVYLCENMVIFADTQNKDCYKCVDFISTSLTYCRVLKQKNKFEIGLRGRKTFKVAAETQTVKDQWCKELKQIIKDELYEDL